MNRDPNSSSQNSVIQGRRVALGRRLAITSRSDWKRLIKQHGGHPIDSVDELTDVLLVSDDAGYPNEDGTTADPAADTERLSVIAENELWQLLNTGSQDVDLSRLYTPRMLAQLLDVSVATIRRWHRRGLIVPAHQINKLPYFDFQEIASARRIARWIQSGQSPAEIERQLVKLAKSLSSENSASNQRPLSQLSIIVEGQQVLLRAGEGLAAADGQLLFNFDAGDTESAAGNLRVVGLDDDDDEVYDYQNKDDDDATEQPSFQDDALADVLPFPQFDSYSDREQEKTPDQFLALATELEDEGDVEGAVEVCRSLGLAHGTTPDLSFRIAELLYQLGDLPAARERYYSAIEQDESFVEARASLGCLLSEMGQAKLAVAAFRGALDYHQNFADAHFHLARLLDEMGRCDEATKHWEAFLEIAPKSPWAQEARSRMLENGEQ